MNNNKICFITAVNDDKLYKECLEYIKYLNIPPGYEVETKLIKNASSMCNAYNQGMKLSDAKYKVYIHQDVFILNKNFLNDILELFKNPSIGMIGVCGCKKLPKSGVWWECSENFGKVYENRIKMTNLLSFIDIQDKYEEVESIDGLIIITQYDLPWREDIFKGWHFYDTSQSMEFKRHNYKIVVPKQIKPWCIHYVGEVSTKGYDNARFIFLNNYSKELE